MDRRKWLMAGIATALLVVLSAAVAIYRARSKAPPKAIVSAPAPATATATPPPSAEIALPGKVSAIKFVNVPVPVDGTVEEFIVDVGEDVTRGEVLARIKSPKLASDQTGAQFGVERARAEVANLESAMLAARLEASRADGDAARSKLELDRAEKEYNRQKLMMSEGVTPRLVFEKAEQDYKNLKSTAQNQTEAAKNAAEHLVSLTKDLENAQAAQQKATASLQRADVETTAGEVTSPADGVVIARNGKAGDPVTRATKDFFQIAVDLTTLEVVVSADPQTLPRIHAGEAATIDVPEAMTSVVGKIREVKADQVYVEFASPSPIIRPGMAARVRIK
jgi:multidrug resistance efflux pump